MIIKLDRGELRAWHEVNHVEIKDGVVRYQDVDGRIASVLPNVQATLYSGHTPVATLQ